MSVSVACLLATAVLSTVSVARAENFSRAQRGHIPSPRDRSWNADVSLGSGIVGFITGGARGAIGPGAGWDVRASFGNNPDIRCEVVYTGSAQRLSDASDVWLVNHGLLALLRVNLTPKRSFEVFFYTGGGWSRFHVRGAMTRNLESPDQVVEIPFGAGIARRYGRLLIDARAGVSVLSAADLLPAMDPTTTARGENMHRFSVRAAVGFEL